MHVCLTTYFLSQDLSGREWLVIEELAELYSIDETLLPDQIAFRLFSRFASSEDLSSIISNKGMREVNGLFQSLKELGYYTISKNVNQSDPGVADFVVARINPRTPSLLREKMKGLGCKIERAWPEPLVV